MHCFRLNALRALGVLAATLFACGATASQERRGSIGCEQLAGLVMPNATINAAQLIPSGTFAAPGLSAPLADLPSFCRVALTVAPQINIEVWMPTSWNNRFQAVGGGGYAGVISWTALADALRQGYAVAPTDTGHDTSAPAGAFALNAHRSLNWPLIEDFAYRAIHEMTLKANSLIDAFYGTRPTFTYFNGCSTGGRQALMEAQRYPRDYDGILAGAPAINRDRFITAALWPQVVMQQDLGAPIQQCKFDAVNAAVLHACDALDGVADGVLDDPRACQFDPHTLQCPEGTASTNRDCLSGAEADAIQKIWDGARSAEGRRLWYGIAPGASFSVLAGPNGPPPNTLGNFRYWIEQDPNADWRTVDYARFESNFEKAAQLFNEVIGTDDPNLERFCSGGGKLLMWHGWADQNITPLGTLDYYQRVLATMGGRAVVHDFLRLFMAPGVAHCGGGSGPDRFDAMGALVRWVEEGRAPRQIVASRVENDRVVRTQPLCAYPRVARWTGGGSTDEAANFGCVRPDNDSGRDNDNDDRR